MKELEKMQEIISQALKSNANDKYRGLDRKEAEIVEKLLKEGKLHSIYAEIIGLEKYMEEEDRKYIEQQIKDHP